MDLTNSLMNVTITVFDTTTCTTHQLMGSVMVPDAWVGALPAKLVIQGIQCNEPRKLRHDERFSKDYNVGGK